MLEWYDNDEVWFTVRAFDAPVGAAVPRAARRSSRRRRRELFTRYLRAISPLYATPREPDGLRASARRAGAAGRLAPAGSRSTPRRRSASICTCPFCRVRCGYCDFNTYTSGELRGARQDQYADTLLREVDLAARRARATPAALRPATHRVLRRRHAHAAAAGRPRPHARRACATAFGIAAGAEVTVEANPDTVTDAVAAELAAAGVTRMSIGMQSAVPHVLAALDRTHEPANVAHRGRRRATRRPRRQRRPHLRRAGGVARGLAGIARRPPIALEPDHISAYALIVEDGTKLARQIRRGEVPAPDDDLQADMYELADDLLAGAGYDWYEVSNWARGDAAPLPPQPRLLAGAGLVGLRSGGAQPHRRACGSGT